MSATTDQLIREETAGPLWQRSLPLSRDRQDTIAVGELARAAFELAESPGGLSATTVKRLAHRLSLPTTRLEQYLPDRSDLLDLMLDTALSEVVLSDAGESASWRRRLEVSARSLRQVALRHPWLVELIGGRPPCGPNGLAFMEDSLAALTDQGVSVVQAAQCVNVIHALVCGSVQMHVIRSAAVARPGSGTAQYLQETVSEGALPNLAELFAAPAGLGPDESFDFGLSCLLDGLSARLALTEA